MVLSGVYVWHWETPCDGKFPMEVPPIDISNVRRGQDPAVVFPPQPSHEITGLFLVTPSHLIIEAIDVTIPFTLSSGQCAVVVCSREIHHRLVWSDRVFVKAETTSEVALSHQLRNSTLLVNDLVPVEFASSAIRNKCVSHCSTLLQLLQLVISEMFATIFCTQVN
eukprot:Sro780_g201481.1  (166) ;mRNA; f:32016-32513